MKCNYCNQKETELNPMLKNEENVIICRNCAIEVLDIIDVKYTEEELNNIDKKNNDKLILELIMNIKPSDIKKELDKHVINQEEAKRALSVSLINHYKRIHQSIDNKNRTIDKSNVLLIGPTGSGKTHIIKSIIKSIVSLNPKIKDIPFVSYNAAGLTASGYVGDDIENILRTLIKNADGDVKLAETGIIFIDEIDKLSNKNPNGKDVGGIDVQQELLKIIEGTEITIPPRKGKEQYESEIIIDTTNILFICGGAFSGIEEIISERLKGDKVVGFNNNSKVFSKEEKEKLLHNVYIEDLNKYGLILEFLGRLHTIIILNELKIEDLKEILTNVKGAIIPQYKEIFKLDKRKLSFDEKSIELIAKESIKHKTNARGLRSIVEKVLLDYMFDVEKTKTIKITEKIVENKLKIM